MQFPNRTPLIINSIMDFLLNTPEDIARELALKLKALRLAKKWKRSTLAERSGVTEASLRRFEQTGKVSLHHFLKLIHALGRLDDAASLLNPQEAGSLKELKQKEKKSQNGGPFERAECLKTFGPVFGLFDDSLPDGWGLLLMDRLLRKQGVNTDRLSVMDRLAFLGTHTMGALIYEPAAKHEKTEKILDLEALAQNSRQITEGEAVDILPALMKTSGSPGGARPKILAGVKDNRLLSDKNGLPPGFEHWMIKFNSTQDSPDPGLVEFAYSMMAKRTGTIM